MKSFSILRVLLLLPLCCVVFTGCPGSGNSETTHPATVEISLQDGDLSFKSFRPKSQPGFSVSVAKEATFSHDFGGMSSWEGKVTPTSDGGFECIVDVNYPPLPSFPDTKLHIQFNSSITDGKFRLQESLADEKGGPIIELKPGKYKLVITGKKA